MSFLEQHYHRREETQRRNYDIDDNLYGELKKLSQVYDASVTELVNAAMQFLIETENITLIQQEKVRLTNHSFLIRNSIVEGFDKLNEKYGIKLSPLVNIAIKNLIEDSSDN